MNDYKVFADAFLESFGYAASIEAGEPHDDRRVPAKARKLWNRAVDSRIDQAIDMAVKYGSVDGAHHKTWVIDQMVRILAGDRYDQIVAEACAGEDGPDTYEWDCGIAP